MSYNLPESLLAELRLQKGFDEIKFIEAQLQSPVTSIRLHPKKKINAPENSVKIPWCENGFYLKERPSFTYDPLFHAGF